MKVKLNIKVEKKNGFYTLKNSYEERRFKSLVQLKHYEMLLNSDYNFVLNHSVTQYGLLMSKVSFSLLNVHSLKKLQTISDGFFWQLKNIEFLSYVDYRMQLIYLEKLLSSVVDLAVFVADKKQEIHLTNMLYNLHYKPVDKPILKILHKNDTVYYHIANIV